MGSSPPPLPLRHTTSRGPLPFLLLGCGGALLFLLLLGGGVLGILYAGNRAVEPAIDAYLDRVEKGDYAAAYANTHATFKQALSEEQFVVFARRVSAALGPYRSKSVRGININTVNGETTTVARYSMTYQNGTASGTFTLINGQIARVDFDSPLLQSAMKCPYCGGALREVTKFCPSCGKPLAEAELAPGAAR